MLTRYGAINPSQVPIINEARKKTFLRKFGVDNPWKATSVKKKIRKTLKEKYGVTNPSKSMEIQAKKIRTFKLNYGKEHWTMNKKAFKLKGSPFTPETIEKGKRTCLKRYGFENVFSSPLIQEKIAFTNLERFGVENPGGLAEVSFKRKIATDHLGKRHVLLGCEPLALKVFSKMKSVIRIDSKAVDVPRYRYKGLDGKMHTYHPDFLVYTKNNQHIVEVKSEWTLIMDIDKNLKKWRVATLSCLRKGQTFWVFVFHAGKLIRAKNPKTMHDLVAAGFPLTHL